MQPPINLAAVRLNPAPNRRVIDPGPIRHELFAQAQSEPQIPALARHNHPGLKLALRELGWLARSHGVTVPDPQLIPRSSTFRNGLSTGASSVLAQRQRRSRNVEWVRLLSCVLPAIGSPSDVAMSGGATQRLSSPRSRPASHSSRQAMFWIQAQSSTVLEG
jgi:hypothetical protein